MAQVVTGRDVRTVRQARLKLEMLVEQARKKQPSTHFLSLPINTPPIQEKLLEFKVKHTHTNTLTLLV